MKIIIDTGSKTININRSGVPTAVISGTSSTTYNSFVAEITTIGLPTSQQITTAVAALNTQITTLQNQITAVNAQITKLNGL